MIRSTAYAAAALAAAAVLGASGAQAATTISSTFDTSADGWRYGSYSNGSGRRDVTYDAATQSIRSAIGIAGGGFVAPSAYLGDKSEYIGGRITFDLAVLSPVQVAERPLIVLRGADQTIFARWSESPDKDLQTYGVDLHAANFYVGEPSKVDGPVSRDLFAAIMADLQIFHVYGDWTVGIDRLQLDNVSMSSAPAPEPATWALMIGGFGLVGSMLRTRRRLQPA